MIVRIAFLDHPNSSSDHERNARAIAAIANRLHRSATNSTIQRHAPIVKIEDFAVQPKLIVTRERVRRQIQRIVSTSANIAAAEGIADSRDDPTSEVLNRCR